MSLRYARPSLALLLTLTAVACSAQNGSDEAVKSNTPAVTQTASAAPSKAADTPTQSPEASEPAAPSLDASNAYTTLSTPVPVEGPPGQIQVLEFFLYTCPHCFHFEPLVTPWGHQLPSHAVLKRVPANFGPNAGLYARAHYAAETLGVLESFRPALFKALQVDRQTIASEADLARVFKAATGIDEKKFGEAFNSFAVDNLVRKADALSRAYSITGVPGLGVNGKYVVTPKAGGFEAMLKVADELIQREHGQ